MRQKARPTLLLVLVSLPVAVLGQDASISRRVVEIEGSVSLHVIESGDGEPVVFIHGLTGDSSVWERQVIAFAAEKYRAIAYSRRYNHPNDNSLQRNHSAEVEAKDLDRLLTKLDISKAHVVGHSYGGYTALLFALEHPERIRTLTLAEPPLVPWLTSLTGRDSPAAKAHCEKLYAHFIRPAKAAFASGNDDKALRAFLDFFAGEDAIDRLPEEVVARCRRNILELKAFTNSEDRYPPVARDHVRKLTMPVLILSGSKSEGVAKYTDAELERLLSKDSSRRIILDGATHAMWAQKPKGCRDEVLRFLREMGKETKSRGKQRTTR